MLSSAWLVSRILSVSLCWPAEKTKWLWLRTRGNPSRFARPVILQPLSLWHFSCFTASVWQPTGFLIVWCESAVWVWNENKTQADQQSPSRCPLCLLCYALAIESARRWDLEALLRGSSLQGQKHISTFVAEFRGRSDWKMQFRLTGGPCLTLTVRNRSLLPTRETKNLYTTGSLEYFYLFAVLLCSLLEK